MPYTKRIHLLVMPLSILAIYSTELLPSFAQSNDIDVRIQRQTRRINREEQEGTLKPKQAAELRKNLKSIANEAEIAKGQGHGNLSATQLTKLDNDLNQNFNNIQTQTGAGKKLKASSAVLGPKWSQGEDGAQDPKKLRTQMKVQEKRQVRQYDQAMQQVQEQQQQQYEKDMLNRLGQQRPVILKNKQDIEEIRQKTGAELMSDEKSSLKIQVLIYDGFDELDVFGVYEPLRMAGFAVELMSLRQQSVVKTIHGVKIFADNILDLAKKPDLLIVPGGGWLSRAEYGAWAEAEKGEILKTLKMFFEAGVILASVCTGSLLLGKAGLLKGRPATTNHSAIEELRDTGAKIMSARVVDDGEIITAGGITSSLDLGLHLIKRFASAEKAISISKQLEFEPRLPIWMDNK